MAIKFEKIEPGMVLADVHREKMGNTTMSEWGCWLVDIISVDRFAYGYGMRFKRFVTYVTGKPYKQVAKKALRPIRRIWKRMLRRLQRLYQARGWSITGRLSVK